MPGNTRVSLLIPVTLSYVLSVNVLGFDAEWGDGQQRGAPSKVSVLQLSSARHTVVFQLGRMGRVPESLQKLLEDRK